MLKVAIVGVFLLLIVAIPASYIALENSCSLQQSRDGEHAESAKNSDTHAGPESGQPDPTATFNLRITGEGTVDGNYYAKNAEREKEDWTHKFWCDAKIGEFALVVFTLFLVVFTGGLWFSTHRLWKAGERQLLVLNRPFVLPRNLKPEAILENGKLKAFEFRLEWANDGNVPAKNVRFHISWEHFLGEIPADFTFPDHGIPGRGGSFISKEKTTWSGPFVIDACVIEAVRQKHIRLYVYGWITYRGVIADAKEHITKFCWEGAFSGPDLYSGAGEMLSVFSTYHRHNCLDEDCA